MEQATVPKEQQEVKQAQIDFKMVTFTLAGKDYGIDIMKVKEISKESKFTFVPNAAPFVRGVYNLRGDIISVIDLRAFFNLEHSRESDNENAADDVIILRLEGQVIAVVVDVIDKVVGIASDIVQPPHPLFGDINIKYISGIVENDERLYIILDVERVFGMEDQAESVDVQGRLKPGVSTAGIKTVPVLSEATAPAGEDVDVGFIEETLVTFQSFYPSSVNRDWIHERYSSWKKQRGENVQLGSKQDADAFLVPFFSPFTGVFWSNDYIENVASFLPKGHRGNFHVWNPGCGSGYESYTVACMVKKVLPDVHLRILAHDNDLIRISTAPALVVDQASIGEFYGSFLTEGTRGRQFAKVIKDSILFEYHDITHDNSLPKLDLVVMRDTVSYLAQDRQTMIFALLEEVLKPGGLLLLGVNEKPSNPNAWDVVEKSGIVAYKKK